MYSFESNDAESTSKHVENRYLENNIKVNQFVRSNLCMHTFLVKVTFCAEKLLNFWQILWLA